MRARSAHPHDYPYFLKFFAELGLHDPVPDLTLWESWVPDAFFLEEVGEIVGYGMCRHFQVTGHVVHVVCDPAWRGRGVGRKIMEEMALRLRQAGCREWFLNVKPDNLAAIRLYQSFGLARAHSSVALRMEWKDVARLPLAEMNLEVLGAPDISQEDERAIGLEPGQMATLLARNYVVLGLRQEGAMVAFAGFDPRFPGANPFRLAHPSLARPLLEIVRDHARPEHDYLGLLAENDPALTALLVSVGARVKLEIDSMRGTIPRSGLSSDSQVEPQ